jgi:hypothetical protein
MSLLKVLCFTSPGAFAALGSRSVNATSTASTNPGTPTTTNAVRQPQ